MQRENAAERRGQPPKQRVGYTVPEAGQMIGLSRPSAYDAARRGEIPTVRFGRRLIVPKLPWERKIGLVDGGGEAA
jgi:excisionase family DNA binding protein